jgi:hypothetical protein
VLKEGRQEDRKTGSKEGTDIRRKTYDMMEERTEVMKGTRRKESSVSMTSLVKKVQLVRQVS